MLAQLTIPESEVIWTIRLVIGYVIAAIAWGIRVEMRLAALAREDKAQAEHTARNEIIMHRAVEKLAETHDSVIRIEEGIKQIYKAVNNK